MTEGLPDAILIRLPTDLAFVRPFRKLLEGLLAGQGWGEDEIEDAALVATEVVQNAIEHGSKNDGRESVEARLTLGAGTFELEVRDPGSGRDPRLLVARDVTAAPDMESARGRGLYLIHRLSARFDRLLSQQGGCVVRVRIEGEVS